MDKRGPIRVRTAIKELGIDTVQRVRHGKAINYYEDWFDSGWEAIKKGLAILLNSEKDGRLILEGAGSPVEVNLQHKDLTK